jgi:hypothetical protein
MGLQHHRRIFRALLALGIACGCAKRETPVAKSPDRPKLNPAPTAEKKSPETERPAVPVAQNNPPPVEAPQTPPTEVPPPAKPKVAPKTKSDVPSSGMTLAAARSQFERAQRATKEGDAAKGLLMAAECWSEARSHKGEAGWDSFASTVFAELPRMERAASRSERSDPTDSTTLILK